MYGVVFVCLGNICRSPAGEAVFKRLIAEKGVALSFEVSSYGTSDCEEDNPVYPPMQAVLKREGYEFSHRARKISLKEIKNADYVLVMDSMNMHDILKLTGGNYGDKILRLGSFLPDGRDIDDPWYTRDFDRAYSEIYTACKNFLDFVMETHREAFGYDKRH